MEGRITYLVFNDLKLRDVRDDTGDLFAANIGLPQMAAFLL